MDLSTQGYERNETLSYLREPHVDGVEELLAVDVLRHVLDVGERVLQRPLLRRDDHAVEVRVHHVRAEPLELADQLHEELLHQVEQGLAERGVVEEGVCRPGESNKADTWLAGMD